MLDLRIAQAIMDELEKEGRNGLLKPEDVCRMQPIPTAPTRNGYTILGVQRGDATVLVWLHFENYSNIKIKKIQVIGW